jgi:hypothetical protein
MACAICKTRREKRQCPGVRGDICAICCGEQREETIDCPLDCEYLQMAHARESTETKDPRGLPNPEFQVTQSFVSQNLDLLMVLQQAVLMGAARSNAIDNDVKEALDGLVRTYRTMESGLYYDSRPANPMASGVFDAVQQRVAEIRTTENERGVHKVTDGLVLKLLMFLQQMEYTFNNGRKRGRLFLDQIRISLAGAADPMKQDPASLIVS